MTDRDQDTKRGTATKRAGSTATRSTRAPQTPKSPSAKRLASKQAAAERARQRRAARRRRLILTVGGTAVGVLALILLVVWSFGGFDAKKHPTAGSSASVNPSATVAAFPQLPPGADQALATKPTVSAGSGTLSKLNVTTLVEGKGAAVASGQSLSVNYVGVTYADGKEFDSSWKRSEAFTFTVGAGNVIKGWDQGLVGVKVGSRVQLDIPPDLAYGDHPSGGQPGGALRFVIDVLSAT
jgi:peptidylprolyl isomerase